MGQETTTGAMLSAQDIHGLSHINSDVLDEAIRQTEMRMRDAMETKNGFEKRGFELLKLSLIACGGALGLAATLKPEAGALFWALISVAVVFTTAMALLTQCIMGRDYGSIGDYPSLWLRRGVLDGDDQAFQWTRAYAIRDYEERLAVSDQSNAHKARYFRWATWTMLTAPLVFAVIMAFA